MERLLQKQTFVMQKASKEHAPHPMFFAGNQVYFISDKPHSLMMISLLVTSLPMNSRNSPAAEPSCRETDSWRATHQERGLLKGSRGLSVMNHMSE